VASCRSMTGRRSVVPAGPADPTSAVTGRREAAMKWTRTAHPPGASRRSSTTGFPSANSAEETAIRCRSRLRNPATTVSWGYPMSSANRPGCSTASRASRRSNPTIPTNSRSSTTRNSTPAAGTGTRCCWTLPRTTARASTTGCLRSSSIQTAGTATAGRHRHRCWTTRDSKGSKGSMNRRPMSSAIAVRMASCWTGTTWSDSRPVPPPPRRVTPAGFSLG
jgi:hypothetical protein